MVPCKDHSFGTHAVAISTCSGMLSRVDNIENLHAHGDVYEHDLEVGWSADADGSLAGLLMTLTLLCNSWLWIMDPTGNDRAISHACLQAVHK